MSAQRRPPPRLVRDSAVRNLDDHIGEMLRAAEASGELRAAKSWGKPLDFGDGYDETPPELRMGYKILKDAGCAPAEVQLLNDVAGLRRELARLEPASPEAHALRVKIVELEATIALRFERIARQRAR